MVSVNLSSIVASLAPHDQLVKDAANGVHEFAEGEVDH
jgi:hypothetical protein